MHRVPELLEDMKAARPRVEPDVITYSTIVKGYCNAGDVEKAFQVLQDMGVVPSNFTLSILVKLLGRSRRLNQAFTMVETICKENGFRPNIFVYTCLIQACIQNRQLGRAITLHDQIMTEE